MLQSLILPDSLVNGMLYAMKKRGPKKKTITDSGPYYNNLGRLRMEAKLTQQQVADASGIAVINISRLENGRIQMTEKYRWPLEKAFGWKTSMLLDKEAAESPTGTLEKYISSLVQDRIKPYEDQIEKLQAQIMAMNKILASFGKGISGLHTTKIEPR